MAAIFSTIFAELVLIGGLSIQYGIVLIVKYFRFFDYYATVVVDWLALRVLGIAVIVDWKALDVLGIALIVDWIALLVLWNAAIVENNTLLLLCNVVVLERNVKCNNIRELLYIL
jgi:hypothetical protein